MDLKKLPPAAALGFFRWFCDPQLQKFIEGDLMELYGERLIARGKVHADIRFFIDVLFLFRPGIIRQLRQDYSTTNGMYKNYLKMAYRTLLQSKRYAFINIMGLALGIGSAMILFLVSKNELTYDRYHKKADRTYRVTLNAIDYNPSVSFAVAPAFRNDFGEAEEVSQYWYRSGALMKVENKLFNEEHYAYADEQFTRIFNFDWLAGDPSSALKDPNSLVLTESLARKYFNSTDVLGRVIRMDNSLDLQVTGVIKDLPSNTHLIFGFLVSWKTIEKDLIGNSFWSINGGYLYITLPDAHIKERVASRMDAFIRKNWGDETAKGAKFILQPLTEIHFDQRYIQEVSMPRSKESVYGLLGIAIFILISASINFVNLATVQSIRRMKEVGIRKALGAYRKQLIFQVLMEIAILVSVSVILAYIGIWTFIPSTSSLLDVQVNFEQLFRFDFLSILAMIATGIVLVAGLYPALIQSAFKPINALNKSTSPGGSHARMSKGLIVVQFAISQLLIIATIVAGSQMDFFINQGIGFDKEAVISFYLGNNKDVLIQKLKQLPGVIDMTLASAGPTHNQNFAPFSCPECGMTEVDVVEIKAIDEHYMPMFKMGLLAGQPVLRKSEGDTIIHSIVNETLIKRMGVPDPQLALGKRVMIGNTPTIVQGVVRDFQSESRHKKIRALIMLYDPEQFYQVSVKLDVKNMRGTIDAISQAWSALNPEWLFSYEFLEDRIAKMYQREEKMYNAIRIFSGIAIVIGCLGLYALVSWIALQRTKEIGVRKVMGASVSGIVGLFFRQFMWLILIAFLLAAPAAWYVMNNWLQEFAYHIEIDVTIFFVSIVLTVTIAGITIGYQSMKAALANPINSLRSE